METHEARAERGTQMILAHRVELNGEQLDDIDRRIIIKGVESGAGKMKFTAQTFGRGIGQRVTSRQRETLDVLVKFSLLIDEDDMDARAELLEEINAWARDGGWLACENKPGRRIWVECVQHPGEGDLYEWTTVYTITFRAYAVPYWQDDAPRRVTASGILTFQEHIRVDGNTETVMDFSYKNTSGSECNSVTIDTGSVAMQLTDLGLENNETLIIGHEEETGLLYIRIRSAAGIDRSAMAKRRSDAEYQSADDLYIQPGKPYVQVLAQRAGNMVISTIGRYL